MPEAETETQDEAQNEEDEEETLPGLFGRPALVESLYHDHGLSQNDLGALSANVTPEELEDLDAEVLADMVVDPDDGVTASAVSYQFDKLGIEAFGGGAQISDERLVDEEWLEEEFVENFRTFQDMADEIGCSDGTVMRHVRDKSGDDYDDWKERRKENRQAAKEEEESEAEDKEPESEDDE